MNKDTRFVRVIKALNKYLMFFLLIGFVISCCMMLFLTVFSRTMGIELTQDNINIAAKLTFANVVFLSLLITVLDAVRRKITVERPVKRIIDAAERIMEGDFSVRVEKSKILAADEQFNLIAEYFNQMAEELSGTETLRTDFIANVSHELKTPLAVIQNYGAMLQSPGLSEKERIMYAKSVTDASIRLASLITNILKLNKLENQQILPKMEVYDLSEQVCECMLGFEDLWEKKGLNIETDIEDGIMVKSDAEMMSLVWNNLFSNAIKFTENGGTISLEIKADGEDAVVKIADTGCGISKEIGTRMFDKFYQGDTSHTTQGNGLGLALVKRVIDITGNEIAVESEMGVGSTFTVRVRRHIQ